MFTFARSLCAVLALVLFTLAQATHARDSTEVVRIPFPNDISYHKVVWDHWEMQQEADHRELKFQKRMLLEEFKDDARGREVILYTGEMCAQMYRPHSRRSAFNYKLRYVFFKGNRMYYTVVDMTNEVREATRSQVVEHCTVDPARRRFTVWLRQPHR